MCAKPPNPITINKYFKPGTPTPYKSMMTNPSAIPTDNFISDEKISPREVVRGSSELNIRRSREMNIANANIVMSTMLPMRIKNEHMDV